MSIHACTFTPVNRCIHSFRLWRFCFWGARNPQPREMRAGGGHESISASPRNNKHAFSSILGADLVRFLHAREIRACLLLCDEGQKGAAVAAIAETMVDSLGGGSVRMRRRALQALSELNTASNEGEDGVGVMKEFEHSTAGNSNFEVHVPLEGDAIEEDALARIGVPPGKSAHVWDGWSRLPLSISGCFGPIGGVIYLRCGGRMWTYDINRMRAGHVHHEAYWDVWGGIVEHGNVRFAHLVPDMVNGSPRHKP